MDKKTICAFLTTIAVSFVSFAPANSYDTNYSDSNYCDPSCYDTSCYDLCASCFDNYSFYAYGDWLYWKVRRSGLDYFIPTPENGDSIIGPSKIVKVKPRYESGFRVGLGLRDDCSGLDLGVRYTRYCTDRKAQATDDDSDGYATRVIPDVNQIGEAGVGFAESRYCLDYNVVDIELGNFMNLPCSSWIKPFVGVKLAFIEEKMDTTYANNPVIDNANIFDFVHEKLELDAYGLSFGFDMYKQILDKCMDLGIYTRFSASLLEGKFKLHNQTSNSVIGTETLLFDVGLKCDQLLSYLEIAAGIQLGLYECCDKTIDLIIGYELNAWKNYTDFIHFPSDAVDPLPARNLAAFGTDGVFIRLVGTY